MPLKVSGIVECLSFRKYLHGYHNKYEVRRIFENTLIHKTGQCAEELKDSFII